MAKKDENIVAENAMDEVKKLTTILTVIIGVVCIFYIITVFVTKNNNNLKYVKEKTISEISYDMILASDIASKKGSYYVLAYDSDNPYTALFKRYLTQYITLDEHDMVYYVDLHDALNQKYVGKTSSFDTTHLVFSGTTLLKLSDGWIESVYDTDEQIESYLKGIIQIS